MNADNSEPASFQKIKARTLIKLLLGFLALLIIYGGGNLFMTGSLSGCEYTEDILEQPEPLRGSIVVMEEDMFVAKGHNPEHCTESFRGVANEIVNPETINNLTIGKRYFEREGRTVEQLTRGKKFTLEKILTETQHGFVAIVSGPGPLYYLLLKDDQGTLYEIFDLSLLDANHDYPPFFKFYKDGQYFGVLSSDYLDIFHDTSYSSLLPLSPLPSTTTPPIWKTYHNELLGFETQYPDNWFVTSSGRSVTFSLPDVPYGVTQKDSKLFGATANVIITRGSSEKYPTLTDYEKWLTSYYSGEKGVNWSWSNLGHEQVNGRIFFKDSAVYEARELDYTTVAGGQLFNIALRIEGAPPLERLAFYPDFLKFISSLKID